MKFLAMLLLMIFVLPVSCASAREHRAPSDTSHRRDVVPLPRPRPPYVRPYGVPLHAPYDRRLREDRFREERRFDRRHERRFDRRFEDRLVERRLVDRRIAVVAPRPCHPVFIPLPFVGNVVAHLTECQSRSW